MKVGNMFVKRMMGAFLVATTAGALATSAFAATPQFNHLQGDPELLTGRNVTKNQVDVSDPVQADTGDTVEGVIYYHNGVAGAPANNVVVSVGMQLGVAASTHVVQASIKSDNAPTVTDTVVDGHVVGKSNLTINLSSQAQIEAVPGSVRWFKDGAESVTPLLSGQTGDEIFSASGLNLGTTDGCWAHAGYVMFKMRFKTVIGGAVMTKSKTAWNDTQGKDATPVVAHAGDQITYHLVTKNTGTANSANFVIEDGIRDILDYADIVSISDLGTAVNVPNDALRDNQTLVRYPAVTIQPGQTVDRNLVVKVKNPIPTTPQNGNAFDFVMFNRYGNSVVIVIEHGAPVVTIQKDVRNVTKGETAFIDSNTANPGDTLEYQVKVKNMSNKAIEATLNDVLPNGVIADGNSFVLKRAADIIKMQGNVFVDGMALHELAQGTEFTLTFRVTTSDKLADNINLVNKARVTFESNQKEDTASTLIFVPKPTPAPTTPSATPSPTQSSLPPTGANPFALVFMVVGAAYTWISRRSVRREFDHLSAYVNIV